MTNTIKKDFIELYNLLEANKNRKVSTILPELLELMTKKNNASGSSNTFVKNDAGETIAVFCYYHKRWELVSECEYGSKKSTATGLNTMCKVGVSNWTKQQRAKKQAEAALLPMLSSGELTVEELPAAQAEIDAASKAIVPREDYPGYCDVNEALEVHANRLNEEL